MTWVCSSLLAADAIRRAGLTLHTVHAESESYLSTHPSLVACRQRCHCISFCTAASSLNLDTALHRLSLSYSGIRRPTSVDAILLAATNATRKTAVITGLTLDRLTDRVSLHWPPVMGTSCKKVVKLNYLFN